jgi:hypothetical protein
MITPIACASIPRDGAKQMGATLRNVRGRTANAWSLQGASAMICRLGWRRFVDDHLACVAQHLLCMSFTHRGVHAQIILIGINLTGTGFESWGGGAGCITGGPCSGNGDTNLVYGSPEYVGLGCVRLLSPRG